MLRLGFATIWQHFLHLGNLKMQIPRPYLQILRFSYLVGVGRGGELVQCTWNSFLDNSSTGGRCIEKHWGRSAPVI